MVRAPETRTLPRTNSKHDDVQIRLPAHAPRARLHPAMLRPGSASMRSPPKGGLTTYVGYDCTGPSLHVGHLLSIMMLRWLQKTGGKPITLMGGGTTRVGDPSGKDETRRILTIEDIEANKESLKAVFARFVDYSGPRRGGDGRQCRVAGAAQLHRFPARRRPALLGQPHAQPGLGEAPARARARAVVPRVQLHDPAGLRLRGAQPPLRLRAADGRLRPVGQHRQRHRSRPAHGNAASFTRSPPRSSPPPPAPRWGRPRRARSGSTRDHLSPYEYWQFWRNTEDGDVGRFLRLFTELPLDEIARLENLAGAEINEAKKVLANEATALLHGGEAAAAAAETARRTFEEGGSGDALPRIGVARAELEAGLGLPALFVRAGLAGSNGEVRRAVANNADQRQ